MTFDEFKASIKGAEPPAQLTELLRALWYDRKGNWEEAHHLAQAVPTADGAWVHAHLHRREGDPGNARYWYRRAGRPESGASIEEEWAEIVSHLLGRL
jgi:hypothetical protein